MALTSEVKAELVEVVEKRPSARKAEAAAMLRFSGALHLVSGRIVIESELDSAAAARRLQVILAETFGHRSDVVMVAPTGIRRVPHYIVRSHRDGARLAAQTGLIDAKGRPIRGIPPAIVSGSLHDAQAAWRGAFLARGSLTEPGRSSALELTCPGSESALAMVGTARRLGVASKAREVRGADRVVLRDGEHISAMLVHMGAPKTAQTWNERRATREVKATAHRLANFDDANLRRSARAAVAAGQRVERAMEILGDDIPDHLKEAGLLRLEHRQASLDELGHLADPPMTKDAVAGRIRRLLAMADKRAEALGIPGTEAALSQEDAE